MEVSLTHVLSCGELNAKKGMTGEGKLLEYGKELEKREEAAEQQGWEV